MVFIFPETMPLFSFHSNSQFWTTTNVYEMKNIIISFTFIESAWRRYFFSHSLMLNFPTQQTLPKNGIILAFTNQTQTLLNWYRHIYKYFHLIAWKHFQPHVMHCERNRHKFPSVSEDTNRYINTHRTRKSTSTTHELCAILNAFASRIN